MVRCSIHTSGLVGISNSVVYSLLLSGSTCIIWCKCCAHCITVVNHGDFRGLRDIPQSVLFVFQNLGCFLQSSPVLLSSVFK